MISIVGKLDIIESAVSGGSGIQIYTVDPDMPGAYNSIKCAALIGYGDYVFDNRYYVQILKNESSVGAKPEGEVQQVVGYDSATGTLATVDFTQPVASGDKFILLHESQRFSGAIGNGTVFTGTMTSADSDNTITCPELAGMGEDFFAPWGGGTPHTFYIQVVSQPGAVGAWPSDEEVRPISRYYTETGKFDVPFPFFSGDVHTGAKVLILHESVVAIGRNDANNAFDSSAVVADQNGSILERLEELRNPTSITSEVWGEQVVTSSTISTFPEPLFNVATGRLYIDQIILKTDATGLAGGTNFQIISTNATGQAVILEETFANLGANKTVTLDTATITKIKTVLETGAMLSTQSTVANGTGAGQVTILVKFQRLDNDATCIY